MDKQYRFGAVIPAAGLSSRMGAFKPLLPCGDSTVIERSVGSLTPHILTAAVVVGYRGDEVAAALKKRFGGQLTIVTNPDYAATDMLRSVQLGLRAIEECSAFFLLPADMPLVPDAVYRALIDAFDDCADVIYPVIDGRRGHPPLIHTRLIPEILAYEGDGGLRTILGGRRVKEVAVTDQGILTDLDTPRDYQNTINRQLPIKR